MVLKKIITVFVFTALFVVTTLIAFAAEEVTVGAENPVASSIDPVASVSASQVPPQSENDTQWAWGEVVNLDNAGKTIILKYLDYETDQEKDIVLAVDEKTAFENVEGFDSIKVKDTLSIDYTVGPDGKNIAKNIGFENLDSSVAVSAQAVEDNKQAVPEQPVANPGAVAETSAAVNEASEPVTQQ
ncbi:MAG: hypothetical protein KJ710_00195 [Candidatus Omnitrophica bacterium]|nr:hypothetical protein [Candidatus Omnitrophota bacterium]MBU1922676.1 hypothetical protein [Candidatus Omnitrophota bacterium]